MSWTVLIHDASLWELYIEFIVPSGFEHNSEYLLVTGEDSVRGLHLDGLDVVLVIGRPNSPDEYTHIAGRTGRAGQSGKVINIVGSGKGHSLASWESTLGVRFESLSVEDMQDF